MDLSRRDALRRLSLLAGGAVSAPALSAILSGCRAEPAGPDWTPSVLTREQADLLATAVDLIIPATDTPGARDVGAHVFIDKLLDGWAEAEERDRFVAGLVSLDVDMREAHGVTFEDATENQRVELLTRLDEEAVAAREAREEPLPFFAHLKEWTLVGYYTSEIGATQELQWLANPGRYVADMPLEEVGRTWA